MHHSGGDDDDDMMNFEFLNLHFTFAGSHPPPGLSLGS
jgi:hypothetical protein